MTSHQQHQQQVSRQRERDRSQRERHGTVTGGPHRAPQSCLFGDPVKNRDEDETTKKIKSTLGDFDQVQRLLLNDHKPLIGISTREITRIQNNKARIEQILSEMRAFPPISGLDEVDNDAVRVQRTAGPQPDDLSMSGVSEDDDESGKRQSPPDRRQSPLRKGPEVVNGLVRKEVIESADRRDASSSSSASSSDSDSDSSSASSSDEMSGDEGTDRKSERDTCSAATDATAANVCWNLGSFVNKSSPKKHPKQQEKGAASGRKDSRAEVTDTDGSKSERDKRSDGENSISQIIEEVATGQRESEFQSSSSASSSPSLPSLSPAEAQPSTPQPGSSGKRKHVAAPVTDGQKAKHLKTSGDMRSGQAPGSRTPVKADKFPNSGFVRNNGTAAAENAILISANSSSGGGVSGGNKKSVSRPEEKTREAKGSLPPAASSGAVRNEMPYVSSSSSSSGTNHSNNVHGKQERNSRINHKENFADSGRVWPANLPQIMCSISLDRLNRIPKPCPTKAHCKEVTNFTADNSPVDRKSKSTLSSSTSSSSKWKSIESKPVLGLKDSQNSRIRPANDKSPSLTQSASISSYRKLPKSSSARLKSENCSPSQPAAKAEDSSPVAKTDAVIPDVKRDPTNRITRDLTPIFLAPGSGSSQAENEALSSDSHLRNAKKLKHEADKEADRTIQLCKYLEAVLFFTLTGIAMEQKQQNEQGVMYRDTLQLMKHIVSKFVKSRPSHNNEIPTTDHKLMALCHRCQSLLMLRLSRFKWKEMAHLSKIIGSQAPEPPLASSQSGATVAVPVHVYACIRKQLNMYAEVTAAHDQWNSADYLIDKHSSCKAFFSALDNECRPLSLNSSLDDLVIYVRTGLKILH